MKSIYGMNRLYEGLWYVPHSWIIDCLEIVGINENIWRLLAESMKSWPVELMHGEENLGDVNRRRGIFQGDSFSQLLFFVSVTTYTCLKCVCYHLHIS